MKYPTVFVRLSPDGQASAVNLNGEWLPVVGFKVNHTLNRPTTVTIKLIAIAEIAGGPGGQGEEESVAGEEADGRVPTPSAAAGPRIH